MRVIRSWMLVLGYFLDVQFHQVDLLLFQIWCNDRVTFRVKIASELNRGKTRKVNISQARVGV